MLDATDLGLLRRLVADQVSPLRRTGLGLMALAPLALVVALLEWGDRDLAAAPPDTAWLAAAVGLLLAMVGFMVWRTHRTPEHTSLYRLLVAERAAVTGVEVITVLNSSYDRIVVHSPLAKEPVRLIVSHRDREAVAALLARAYGPGRVRFAR